MRLIVVSNNRLSFIQKEFPCVYTSTTNIISFVVRVIGAIYFAYFFLLNKGHNCNYQVDKWSTFNSNIIGLVGGG